MKSSAYRHAAYERSNLKKHVDLDRSPRSTSTPAIRSQSPCGARRVENAGQVELVYASRVLVSPGSLCLNSGFAPPWKTASQELRIRDPRKYSLLVRRWASTAYLSFSLSPSLAFMYGSVAGRLCGRKGRGTMSTGVCG